MKISLTRDIEGKAIGESIGVIRAASAWHAPGNDVGGVDWQARALENLVEAAKEYDADAIVEVNFEVDGVRADDFAGPLERVWAKGLAVKLARG